MGGVRLLLGVVCLWLPQIVSGDAHAGGITMNMFLDAQCTEAFTGEGPHQFKQSADDKLCWNMGTDMSAKVVCDVDGKLDVKMYWNMEGTPTAPKCTGDAPAGDMHLNGMDRADAMAFLTGGTCMQQPKSMCDPTDLKDGKACYMYAKLDKPVPEDGFPSACGGASPAPGPSPSTTAQAVSAAVAKNILGVSGGLAAFLALWF